MNFIEDKLIPRPKKLVTHGGQVKLTECRKALFKVVTDSEDIRVLEGIKIIEEKVRGMVPVTEAVSLDEAYEVLIKVDKADVRFQEIYKKEAYYLDITEERAVLCGLDEAGAFYAAVTFTEILCKEGSDVYVPTTEIVDYPDFERRGHFFECRYGTEFMGKEDWFKAIDYISMMKCNQLTIGIYGCWSEQYDGKRAEYLYIPIKKYPQLKTPKNIKYYSVAEGKWVYQDNMLPRMFEEDSLGEIMAYGKKRNVMVKPFFNSLGHNTLLPKTFPEISAKTEAGESTGFGFCTENEKTYEVLYGIYDEIIERYLAPNGLTEISIGLDEVFNEYRCQCKKCTQREYPERMISYIIKLCKYLKAKGMKKIHICHDMLYHEFNRVDEELKELFIKEGIYDEVILDWWSYDDPTCLFMRKADGINNLFHSTIKPYTGYFNWVIPTEGNDNIRACVKLAKERSFEGVEAYGSYDVCYDKNYLTMADIAWNSDEVDKVDDFNRRYAYRNYPENMVNAMSALEALRDIMKNDVPGHYFNKACYKLEYYYYSYNRPALPYPQRFPEAAFELVRDKEEEYLYYLKFVKEKATAAIDFLNHCSKVDKLHSNRLLTAKQYQTLADEYLGLYQLHKAYHDGLADEYIVLREIDRLLEQREALMSFAEDIKYTPAKPTYLRNMSIFRQLLCDLKSYFKKEISAGRKPEFDLYHLKGSVLSDEFEFLR